MKLNTGAIIGLVGGLVGAIIGVASAFMADPIVGIGVGCVMIAVFYLFYRVLIKPAMEHSRLLKNGTPATGTILSVQETGTRINNQPLVKLRLQVNLANNPPYEVETKTVVSYFQIATVQPGNTLQLMVDPQNKMKVTIVRDGESPQANPLANASPKEIEDFQASIMAMEKENQSIKAVGIYCKAIVTKYTPMGVNINGPNPLVTLELQVLPDNEPAFAGTAKAVIKQTSIPLFQPGEEIFVRYDPNDKTRVAVEHS